jgi:hypothetical protein
LISNLKFEIASAVAVAFAVSEMNSSHKYTKQILQAAPAFVAAEPQKHGGSPRIYSGEERFSAPEKSRRTSMRSSAGPGQRRFRRECHSATLPSIFNASPHASHAVRESS